MSGDSKFSSKRPKGDAWGVEDSVAKAADEFRRTGRSPMIPFIGVLAVSKIEMMPGDDGHPVYTAVVEIRRANSLDSDESIRAGQKLLLQAIKEREGDNAVQSLPLDERQIIMQAFGGVDSEELAIDDQELLEDEPLTDPDRLRRHLVKVHGMPADDVDQMEMFDVQKTHQAAHDPLSPAVMPHDVEWWAWRRIVIAERASELRADGVAWGETETDQSEPEVDDEQEMRDHLINVHDFDPTLIESETLTDMRHRHVADHDTPPEDGFPAHPLSWLGSSRDDLDAAEAVAEDDQTSTGATADENTED